MKAVPLARCSPRSTPPPMISSAFLSSTPPLLDAPQTDSAHVLELRVVNYRNVVWRDGGAIAASSDGAFHPLWIEAGNGEGQLKTATITIGRFDRGNAIAPEISEPECDISQRVAILYEGGQRYEADPGILSVSVRLKNKGPQPLRAPVFLRVETLTSPNFEIEVVDAVNHLPGPGAIWDLTPAIPSEVLRTGTRTKPYRLQFRLMSLENSLTDEVLRLSMKAFSCASASSVKLH